MAGQPGTSPFRTLIWVRFATGFHIWLVTRKVWFKWPGRVCSKDTFKSIWCIYFCVIIYIYYHTMNYYICIYTCINLEFNIYYIQRFTMIHPLYVMVFPRPFQNKKSEAATQAAILANPLLLLATTSGLGPQQSVYDYFGVAVPWVGGDRIHGIVSRNFLDQGNTRINGLFHLLIL